MCYSDIIKELKKEIEDNQIQLQQAIRIYQKKYHQNEETKQAENEIVAIGKKQKKLLAQLREENKKQRDQGLEKNSANKENNLCPLNNSTTDEENESKTASSNSAKDPIFPQDLTKNAFLSNLFLATEDAFNEMERKRTQKRRRSTANASFYRDKSERWPYSDKTAKKNNINNNKKKKSKAAKKRPVAVRKTKKPKKIIASTNKPVISTAENLASEESPKNGNDKAIIKETFTLPLTLPNGITGKRINSSG